MLAAFEMAPGDTLGPYVIEALIAEGGMGSVFRAKNRVTGQLRALKVVRAELVRDREFVDRFVREATIASSLRHPNLVETLEPGIEADTIYLPMELLVGETLAQRLKRLKRMSPQETADLLAPLCEAIQLLHDQNLVHRDLKPANIFIAKVGGKDVPKVIDLGTARDVADAEHTMTGMVVGSPFYMAPEQAEGRRDVDGRADQYALGVVAYQMVTAARPYESDDTRSALAKLMRGDPYAPPSRVFPGVPAAVEAAIVRALCREREGRFPRIVDFGRALAAAATNLGGVATVMDLGDAVEQAKAMIAARPVLTVSASAETQIRDIESIQPPTGRAASPTLGPGLAGAPTPAAAPVPVQVAAGPGFAAPPPATPAPTPAGRGGVLVIAIAVVALLAVVGAAAMWFVSSQQAAEVQPRAIQLDVPTEGTPPASEIAPLATGVGAPPPVTGVVIPPLETGLVAPPPVTLAAPPPATGVAPPPPVTRAAAPPSTSTPRATSSGSTSSGGSGHGDGPTRRPAPSGGGPACGAATGIPCLE